LLTLITPGQEEGARVIEAAALAAEELAAEGGDAFEGDDE
jgi:hypothetical protein